MSTIFHTHTYIYVCVCLLRYSANYSYDFQECIQYGVNLDITSYTDGKRETHNPTGRAYAPVVWDFYQVRANWVMEMRYSSLMNEILLCCIILLFS